MRLGDGEQARGGKKDWCNFKAEVSRFFYQQVSQMPSLIDV